MPTPTQQPILRSKDFTPDINVDKAAINTELDNIINALNAVIGNLSDVRRDDGQLRSVLADEAAAAALASQQATQALHDVVVAKEALMNPHYAAIDNVYANIGAVIGAAQEAINAAASATNAANSASNASASAGAAATSETNAATSATAAANSAAAAATSETNAASSAAAAAASAAQVGNPIPLSEKGAPNGVATLDNVGKVPNAQLPATALTQDIPLSQKGVANGVATLDANGFLTASQLSIPHATVNLTDAVAGYKTASFTLRPLLSQNFGFGYTNATGGGLVLFSGIYLVNVNLNIYSDPAFSSTLIQPGCRGIFFVGNATGAPAILSPYAMHPMYGNSYSGVHGSNIIVVPQGVTAVYGMTCNIIGPKANMVGVAASGSSIEILKIG